MLISNKKKKIDDTKKHSKELMIEQILEKIGLGYDYLNNIIEIQDMKKWEKRSMMFRIKYSMPSTTNSLESAHGHLNKKTPRRNNFWSSLYRVISNLTKQNHLYKEKVMHNYNHVIRKTKNRAKNIPKERMKNEMLFYRTTLNNCNCSENKVVSSQLGFQVPCSHQLQLKTFNGFPKLPDINITLENQWNDLCDDYNIVLDLSPEKSKKAEEKDYLINTIKFYSKYKGDEIKEFVDAQLKKKEDQKEFILNKPTWLIKVIDEGIKLGIGLKKKVKQESFRK